MNNKNLKEELENNGFGFEDMEDGTYLVHYDKNIDDFSVFSGQGNCEIREDNEYYYIDLRDGNGEALYPKNDWSLASAIEDYTNC